MKQKVVKKGLEFGKDALNRYRLLNDYWGISHAMLQLGKDVSSIEKLALRLGYYYETIRTAAKANDHIQIIEANKHLGRLYLEAHRLDSSYLYLRRALVLALGKNNKINEMESSRYLAEYFSEVDNLDSSPYYTKEASVLEREIFDSQKSQQIATTQMLYKFEKKEQMLTFKEDQIQRQYVGIIGVSAY